ncbi:MAG: CHASE2 domain-containing protein [Nitrospirales bacterium]
MTFMRSAFRSSSARVLGIGILVGLTVLSFRQFGVIETLELSAYDWTVRLASPFAAQDPRIVLITITEEDIHHFGQWPISDSTLASALGRLGELGARAIGLDLYRDNPVQPGTDQLNAVFTKHRNIVTVMKFPDQDGKRIPGPSILAGTDQVGFNDILVDPGGTVRRGFLFLENQEGTAISFSLLLTLKYLEQDGIVPYPDPTYPEFMRIGKTTIPRFQSNDGSYVESDANGYQVLMKFLGKESPFLRFSLAELLSGRVTQEMVADKIVVIGSVADSVRDDFYTPYSLGLKRKQQVPGMEIHAHLISQILRIALTQEHPIRSLSEALEAGWIILWGIVGALCALGLFSPWRWLLLFGGGLGGLGVIVYWAYLASWWIPFVSPAIAWVTAGSIATAWVSKRNRQERMKLMQLFSQHVSSEIADTIWANREHFIDHGGIRPQQLTATVLFADLEGFSAVGEQLNAQTLMEWVNTYLMAMANAIAAHGGVVDDFFGDGVKANFGVPLIHTKEEDIRQDAINAVRCGLVLIHEVQRVNQIHLQQGLPVGKVRIGIATGSVVAGTVGSAQRLKYTTVGDTVNIAARLEQLGKVGSFLEEHQDVGRLMIMETTKNYLGEHWETQNVGNVSLPGKRESVTVYRIVSGTSERMELNS